MYLSLFFLLEEILLLMQRWSVFHAIAILILMLKYVCKLQSMKITMFPPFHFRVALVKLVNGSPDNLTFTSAVLVVLLLMFGHLQFLAQHCPHLDYSSGKRDAYELCDSYMPFKRCSLNIPVTSAKKSLSSSWNLCFSSLIVDNCTFSSLSSPLKQDFKLIH